MTKAQLTVLAGPTAVGKGTVVAALTKRYPTLNVSVSATTRDPRPGELNGVHYYFVSAQEFDAMIDAETCWSGRLFMEKQVRDASRTRG